MYGQLNNQFSIHNVYTCRYTTNSISGSVYAIVLKWPEKFILTIGSVKTTNSSEATLLGYGKVQLMSGSSGQVNIMMPYLPLDTPLQWAWVIKLDNIDAN